jgi:hypothetical protein
MADNLAAICKPIVFIVRDPEYQQSASARQSVFKGQFECHVPGVFRHWCTKSVIDSALSPAAMTHCSPAANGQIAAFYL